MTCGGPGRAYAPPMFRKIYSGPFYADEPDADASHLADEVGTPAGVGGR